MERTGAIRMKHKNLYALTLTSAAMLCGTGTIAWAQDHDAGQAPATHSGSARNQLSSAVRASKLIGDKKIAVPYKSFSVAPDGKTLYLDMTADQLKSMPPYTDDEKGEAAAHATSQNNASNKFEHGTATTSSTAAGAAKTPHVLKANEEPASALIGAEVVDKGDAKVG